MATYENEGLNMSNFMSTAQFTEGKGTNAQTLQKLNYYDQRLLFMNKSLRCQRYNVTTASFLPNISYKFYQTTSLWWVIAKFNKIVFPLSEVQVGTTLLIPNLSDLSKEITSVNSSVKSSSKVTI